MLRMKHLIATAAVVALSAAPASAATWEDTHPNGTQAVPPPPSSIASSAARPTVSYANRARTCAPETRRTPPSTAACTPSSTTARTR